jgi:Uma2 family endonuclease
LEKRLEGTPELVVEVFSPGSVSRDKRDKFQLYQRHGIAEYWMVDPAEGYLEVYTLENKRYVRLGVFVDGETFTSPALRRDVTLGSIFADAQGNAAN